MEEAHDRSIHLCDSVKPGLSLLSAFSVLSDTCEWNLLHKIQEIVLKMAKEDNICCAWIESILLTLNRFNDINREEVFHIHKKWGQCIKKSDVIPYKHDLKKLNHIKKIKVGYLSGDFREHSVGHFIENIIKEQDREKFEIYCYSNSNESDEITKRIRKNVHVFANVGNLTDNVLAHKIYEDGIHILVDLSGHTADSKIIVLAYNPAPVQVTYLGYPNTTGLDNVDYRLTDYYSDSGNEDYYTEKLWFLPDSFLCFGKFIDVQINENPPVERNGYITFGSFNNINKLTREVIKIWSDLLARVHESILIIKSGNADKQYIKINILSEFEKHGISSERIKLMSFYKSKKDHLASYNEIDIALDTFPYNGTTTTCEALWMGVPVVTLIGESHAQRVSYSILKNIGYEETLALSEQDYITKAVDLVKDINKLKTAKNNVSSLIRRSILCDAKKFTSNLEQAYIDMLRDKSLSRNNHESEEYPEWIFIIGMARSGSTWVYNVVKELLNSKKIGVVFGFVGEDAELDYFISSQGIQKSAHKPGLIKFHLLSTKAKELIKCGRAKAIYSKRDIRDVVVSRMDFENITFEEIISSGKLEAILSNHEQINKLSGILSIEYEDIMSIPFKVMDLIQEYLDIKIDRIEAEKIIQDYSIESTKRIANSIANKQNILNKLHYDSETLIHAGHIASGKPGRYLDKLSDEQLKIINSIANDYLVNEGYVDPIVTSELFSKNINAKDDYYEITITNEIIVCVPKTLNCITTYVLLEQNDWFESETNFIRHYLQKDMKIIDIGANYGMYSLISAIRIGTGGEIWSFEPATPTASYLQKSVLANSFDNINVINAGLSDNSGKAYIALNKNSEHNEISEECTGLDNEIEVEIYSLDQCIEKYGLNGIDFIKMDAEGHEMKILDGGVKFFAENSPLVMYEIKNGTGMNNGLLEKFQDFGYSSYRLIPGLDLLVPFNMDQNIDSYLLNLFCCKDDQAQVLHERSLLIQEELTNSSVPLPKSGFWVDVLSGWPYSKSFLEQWASFMEQNSTNDIWLIHQQALDYYAHAHNSSIDMPLRYAYMRKSYLSLGNLIKDNGNISNIQSFVRISIELGERQQAAGALNYLIKYLKSKDIKSVELNEPFLPVSNYFQLIEPKEELFDWVKVSIYEELERQRAFSSYFSDRASFENIYSEISNNRFLSKEMKKRHFLKREKSLLK
ncbi:MAG: FkbM family methyltransferase [Gammaproteobacteria bacterium]|nr:FkbM family methyltransferase [Gammaproteobacteria bacterium]